MPSEDVVRRALELLRSGATAYQYFFDNLKSPDWIEPLEAADRDIFRKAPPPEPEEPNLIRYPMWPASRYLARMAPKAPALVLRVILAAEQTENPRVHEDFAEAAISMPADLAAKWVAQEVKWLTKQKHLFLILPLTLGRLVSHLARGGEPNAALSLASVLLEPHAREDVGDDDVWRNRRPATRLDDWDYSEFLRMRLPDLIGAAGMDAYRLLCDLLDEILRIELGSVDDAHGDDLSYIWRPAIEEHEQNEFGNKYDIQKQLVGAIRSAAESLIETDPTYLEVILTDLRGRRWAVYQRLGLYLLGRFRLDGQQGLLRAWLLNSDVLGNPALQHELRSLIRARVGDLDVQARSALIEVLKTRTAREEELIREAKEDEVPTTTEQVERRRLARLGLVAEWLEGNTKDEYDALTQEYGEARGSEFPVSMSVGWGGPTSPLSDEELIEMTVSDLISYIKSWTPAESHWGDSVEGLTRGISADVQRNPEKYASGAEQIGNLTTPYVWAVLEGFWRVAKDKKPFSWQPVLALAERFLLEDHDDNKARGRFGERYPSWARMSIARLLGDGLAEGESQLPFDLREQVWRIIRQLTDDPEPDPAYEQQYGGDNMDAFTLSLNVVRGEAMNDVVEYALWVSRAGAADSPEKFSFEAVPEVREVLEAHLEPQHDPSLAIRAVYGRWLPWLHLMDADWVRANLPRIIPEDERGLREAALSTYVVLNKPYDNMFEDLLPYYRSAIDALAGDDLSRVARREPAEGLAAHILPLYWRGLIPLEDEDSLVRYFFNRSSDDVRNTAIDFVGRSLRDTDGDVPEPVLTRLKALWEWRDSVLEAAGVSVEIKESEGFGWWFISGKLDDAWSLTHLLRALRRHKKAEPDHLVMEGLAGLAPDHLKDVLEAVKLILEGDVNGWGVHLWEAEVRTILTTARSGDEEARNAALAIANFLGARGFLQFRDLAS